MQNRPMGTDRQLDVLDCASVSKTRSREMIKRGYWIFGTLDCASR